jgi:hypothetical protein
MIRLSCRSCSGCHPAAPTTVCGASVWAELADLDAADVAPVLRLLAQADVGGYVATPGGTSMRRSVIHRLWVDSLQYHRAEDVLMAYLNHRRSVR